MKKINYYLILSIFLLSGNTLKAQEGVYFEELYDVQVETDVVYAANASILPVLAQQSAEALQLPQIMDVYTPIGDNNDSRPVMMVLHTGNFLPFPNNNGTGGTIKDSTVIETCTRLAKRGYIACAMDYRLGWNPIDPNQDVRTFFLINAAYRGLQDARSAARFIRKGIVDGGNPYSADPDKIGIWGIGTGGYIAAAVATLDEYSEILIPKFFINLGGGDVPMVIQGINGNIDGTSVGIVPAGYPVLPEGDTLCYPQHVNYADGTPISSDFGFVVNNGGALGDISWLDENVVPWVSFHVPSDPFAPYECAVLTVPGTGDPDDPSDDFAVVEVCGSYTIQEKMNELGFNDIFDMVPDNFLDYHEVADARNDGFDGLFPFPNNTANMSAPWDFYQVEDHPNVPPNPPSNPALARTYWDTIFAYVTPRACLALELKPEIECGIVGTNEVLLQDHLVTVAPNPATDYTVVSTTNNEMINHIEVYNIEGKRMALYQDVQQVQKSINLSSQATGMYVLKIHLADGIVTKKVMVE